MSSNVRRWLYFARARRRLASSSSLRLFLILFFFPSHSIPHVKTYVCPNQGNMYYYGPRTDGENSVSEEEEKQVRQVCQAPARFRKRARDHDLPGQGWSPTSLEQLFYLSPSVLRSAPISQSPCIDAYRHHSLQMRRRCSESIAPTPLSIPHDVTKFFGVTTNSPNC